MTDKDKLVALLTEFGVNYTYCIVERGTDQLVVVGENEHIPPVTGYLGFYTSFAFDSEGKFISMGAWE